MTFSIAGHCARTGAFGVAITTSSIAVGARCPHARAGVGAVATQNVTDPALGLLLLDLMERGLSARAAIDAITRDRPGIDYRQLTAVDRHGGSASWSGAHILGRHGVSERPNAVAAGNLLATSALPEAMTAAFALNPEAPLAERLLGALEAGLAAGGEEGPLHSAALLVFRAQSYPFVSLRVDWDEAPLAALRRLWIAYEPQAEDYLQRALTPEGAKSFNVPGDP
jgi:uncharacterized Ntn-hydrolase superfamily protein